MQETMCMQKVDGAGNQHIWLRGPADPVLLPLLICCVAVALVAAVTDQKDGDQTEGASFVAWGLERSFFLQQGKKKAGEI